MANLNLVNLERVSKSYDIRRLLDAVSLGVGAGERIGLVGANGTGKTTLLGVLAGTEPPDTGRVAHNGGLRIGFLTQRDTLDGERTVADTVVGDRPEHEWQADRRVRDILDGLLADVPYDKPVGVLSGGERRRTDNPVGVLSGGERRRTDLARLLVEEHDLLLLDEPTNHLDIEVTDWLARHLAGRREALVVVTHDRWFLDAVCTTTWELVDGRVESYEGGYSAYVLAKTERARIAAAGENRRQNLLRKELAWLHRGAKARTSKPKFRLDAAAALIADEPPPRDTVQLARFATSRLGKTVIELSDVDVCRGGRTLLDRLTWQLGPGDRLGVVGINGSGKSSLLRVLSGEDEPDAGRVVWGRTVVLGHLSQELGGLDPEDTVLDAVEQIRRVVKLAPQNIRPGAIGRRPVPAHGPEVSATSLLERFGFRGDKLKARVGDLSGGERRRLELLALLLDEPNVLLLDEPTNDLDIETLQMIEDFLDGWPGSLVVVTHDRYFLERVCDTVWALLGEGTFGLLPGGVDEYLDRRRSGPSGAGTSRSGSSRPGPSRGAADGGVTSNPGSSRSAGVAAVSGSGNQGHGPADASGSADRPDSADGSRMPGGDPRRPDPGGADRRQASRGSAGTGEADVRSAAAVRAAKKELAKLERQIARLGAREEKLRAEQAEHAADYQRLMELAAALSEVQSDRDALETRWLEVAEAVE